MMPTELVPGSWNGGYESNVGHGMKLDAHYFGDFAFVHLATKLRFREGNKPVHCTGVLGGWKRVGLPAALCEHTFLNITTHACIVRNKTTTRLTFGWVTSTIT